MADKPDKMAVTGDYPSANQTLGESKSLDDMKLRTTSIPLNVTSDGLPKKKSSFKITSVIPKVPERSGSGDAMQDLDGDSMDDLDESRADDVTSEIFDSSRNTDVDQENSSEDTLHTVTPDEIVNKEKTDTHSRFKVVKIETKEPFRRGRWFCHDFLDTPAHAEKNEIRLGGLDDIHSGNSSAASSIHYVHGVDDPSKNPLASGSVQPHMSLVATQQQLDNAVSIAGHSGATQTQGEVFQPIHPAVPQTSHPIANTNNPNMIHNQIVNQTIRSETPQNQTIQQQMLTIMQPATPNVVQMGTQNIVTNSMSSNTRPIFQTSQIASNAPQIVGNHGQLGQSQQSSMQNSQVMTHNPVSTPMQVGSQVVQNMVPHANMSAATSGHMSSLPQTTPVSHVQSTTVEHPTQQTSNAHGNQPGTVSQATHPAAHNSMLPQNIKSSQPNSLPSGAPMNTTQAAQPPQISTQCQYSQAASVPHDSSNRGVQSCDSDHDQTATTIAKHRQDVAPSQFLSVTSKEASKVQDSNTLLLDYNEIHKNKSNSDNLKESTSYPSVLSLAPLEEAVGCMSSPAKDEKDDR